MPKYKTEVTHDLGQEEALARLKDFSERARSFSDLQGRGRRTLLSSQSQRKALA